MKPGTKDDYIQRIDRVVGFLNQQVEGTPSLQDLADVAAISPYHFTRVYQAITGETPLATMRRLRMARAAILLRESKKSVTEIAFNIGYDSSQSFAKAFRDVTGFSASTLREKPEELAGVIKTLSSPPAAPSAKAALDVRLVSVEPFKVIAYRHTGPHKGLFTAYGELHAWAEKAGWLKHFRGIYGIPIDDPRGMPESECRFDCCFDFGSDVKPSDGYREEFLGGGLYAVARHVGPYDGLEEKYDQLYGAWLNSSGFVLQEKPFFNHYLQDPDTAPPEEWETDIYLPVKKIS